MKLKNVYRLASVESIDLANKLLEHGWKLLKVTTTSYADDRYIERGICQHSTNCFILGATKQISDQYSQIDAKHELDSDQWDC